MNQDKKTVRLATLGVLTALAFIFSYLESLLPAFTGVPGVKAGFANITVIIAMYMLGWKEALILGVVRVVLSGLTFSGLFTMIYGLAGTLLSITVMLLLKKVKGFSLTAISIAGGVSHNIGQIIVAILVTGSAIVYYLPVLILSGAAAGFLTGIISSLVLRRLKKQS